MCGFYAREMYMCVTRSCVLNVHECDKVMCKIFQNSSLPVRAMCAQLFLRQAQVVQVVGKSFATQNSIHGNWFHQT